MIAAQGFDNVHILYLSAMNAIRARAVEFRRSCGLSEGRSRWHPPQSEENFAVAAKFLAYDVLVTGNAAFGSPVILTGVDMVATSNLILRPPRPLIISENFNVERRNAMQEGSFIGRDYVFGLSSLKSNYWLQPFETEAVFEYPTNRLIGRYVSLLDRVPIFNWNLGCIDLRAVRALAKSYELNKEADRLIIESGLGLRLSYADRHLQLSQEAVSVLNMFGKFDGAPVLCHPDMFSLLSDTKIAPELPDNGNDSPRDLILDTLEKEPNLRKGDLKKMLFPDLSDRQFQWHWRQAADIKPEISKSGRRKVNS